jgi:hypothetical protein
MILNGDWWYKPMTIPEGWVLVDGKELDTRPRHGINRCWNAHAGEWHEWWGKYTKSSMRQIVNAHNCYSHFIRKIGSK